MNKIYLLLFISAFGFYFSSAQTNVSGSILANTTWTKANSPYIVVDTVVVFPNVTLTIEPGVTVKFADSMSMEIRGASLIAIGTVSDSITFTSNSFTPRPGIWNEIYLKGDSGNLTVNFNYCNFRYAASGVESENSPLTIKNSDFNNNNNGMSVYYDYLIPIVLNMDSCIFINNGTGILGSAGTVFISNSVFQSNYTGFSGATETYISNSKFFNDTSGIQEGDGDIYLNNCVISNNEVGVGCGRDNTVIISNCIIDSNSYYGITASFFSASSIDSCEIRGNGIAIGVSPPPLFTTPAPIIRGNGIGARVSSTLDAISIFKNSIENNNIGIYYAEIHETDSIFCNKICDNTSYGLYNAAGNNINVSNNYWCSSDSATVQSYIFDAHDSVGVGLVTFMPIDTIGCYIITEVANYEIKDFTVSIYPNPASNQLTIHTSSLQSNEALNISVINVLGQETLPTSSLRMIRGDAMIDINNLPVGIYFVQLTSEKERWVGKFVKE